MIQLAKCHFDNKSEKGESETGENINKGVAKKENAEEDYVTIGMIGQPNAGKSSLINGLLEDKKVSVSKTPGHTKHFQTIFYSAGIRLVTCTNCGYRLLFAFCLFNTIKGNFSSLFLIKPNQNTDLHCGLFPFYMGIIKKTPTALLTLIVY